MKISTSKTEGLRLSKNSVQFSLQVGGASLKQVEKFKYLGVAFTSDGIKNEELDVRSGKASAVMRTLHQSVVFRWKLSRKAKLLSRHSSLSSSRYPDNCPNAHHPEWTPSRMALSRIYTIPNGHHIEWHNPEWGQSRMSTCIITEVLYTQAW